MKHYLYRIVNTSSKEQYIGVSNAPLKRWMEHADADSRVGRNLRMNGIESFSFSIIGAFPSREDAQTAEREWIERENPELNVVHRQDIVAPEDPRLFDGSQDQQSLATRWHPSSLKTIDNEMLKDNEYFEVLHQEAAKIVVHIKKTKELERIGKKPSANDLVILAPLGWWNSLVGVAQHTVLTNKHILPIVSAMIQIAQQNTDKKTSIDGITRVVASYYHLKESKLLSPNRSRSVARPRQMAMYLAREHTDLSLPQIGDRFGGRDHTTVLHACRKMEKLVQSDTKESEDYRNLERLCGT